MTLRAAPCAGIIGAGTNNARLAGLLRGLASYYYKEPTLLFLVRAAQGLVHAGKGLLNLAPTHTDGHLVSGGAPPLLDLPFCPLGLQSPTKSQIGQGRTPPGLLPLIACLASAQ